MGLQESQSGEKESDDRAEIGVMDLKGDGRGHRPRNADDHKKLKKSRKQILSFEPPGLLTP